MAGFDRAFNAPHIGPLQNWVDLIMAAKATPGLACSFCVVLCVRNSNEHYIAAAKVSPPRSGNCIRPSTLSNRHTG